MGVSGRVLGGNETACDAVGPGGKMGWFTPLPLPRGRKSNVGGGRTSPQDLGSLEPEQPRWKRAGREDEGGMVQVRKGALRWSLVVAGTQEAWQATWVPAAEELRSFHAWSAKDDHVLGRMWENLGLG